MTRDGLDADPARSSTVGRLRDYLATPKGRDTLAITLLVIIPICIYVPLSLSGNPVLPGDDLNQNFPLRVLAGEILRSGRLPAWDPLIWSGTPLLAGWNAGAMFPGTWLFAILPALTAWTINLVAVPIIAGTGMYVLMRRLSCRAFGAFGAAAVFTYTGFMSGQIVHLGLVQGTACTPWLLLGIDGLHRSKNRNETLGWGLLVAVSTAFVILAADPRAVSSALIAGLIYMLACALRLGRKGPKMLVSALFAAGLGVALAALQWLPGLGFLHSSQRSSSVYSFFGAGSIAVGHLASLLTVPFLLGANGNFGQPVYAGNYNLPELTVGAGFVALIGVFFYLPDATAALVTSLRSGSGRVGQALQGFRSGRQVGVWYVLGLVGAILTLGTTTAFGHLLVHIPFFNGERLQNRNAALFDIALAVFAGFVVDDFGKVRPAAKDAAIEKIAGWIGRFRDLICTVPMLGAIGTIVAAFVAPSALETDLHVPYQSTNLFNLFAAYLVVTALFAAALIVFVLFARRFAPRQRRAILAIFLLCDVATYVALGDYENTPSTSLTTNNPQATALHRLIGSTGRFALYNPAQELTGVPSLAEIGVTDDNILQSNPSVQGYGSIVNGIYQNATDTHSFEDLNLAGLSGSSSSFSTLDLKALLSLPTYFGEPIGVDIPVPLGGGEVVGLHGTAVSSPNAQSLPPEGIGAVYLGRNKVFDYTLPSPAALVRASIYLLAPKSGPVLTSLTVRVIGADEHVRTVQVPVNDYRAVITLGGERVAALAIVNQSAEAFNVGGVIVLSSDPNSRLVLDGALQGSLDYQQWHFAGVIGLFDAYVNDDTAGLAWLQPAKETTPNVDKRTSGTVVVESSPVQAQRMLVTSPGAAVLARSEGYSSGWSAKIEPVGGGPARSLPVHRFGLIQSIDMPAGRYVVTWNYAPRNILIGGIVTLIATFVLLNCFVVFIFVRRRQSAHNVGIGIGDADSAPL